MATRQIFIDDLDGTEDGVETVTFGLDGTTFEVDLGAANQEKLREFLDSFVAVARPLGRDGVAVRRRTAPKRATTRKMAAAAQIKDEQAAIPTLEELPKFDSKIARTWLRDNGHEVPDRGRIRAEVALPYIESDDFKAWQATQG